MNSDPVGSPWGWNLHKWSLNPADVLDHLKAKDTIRQFAQKGLRIPGTGNEKYLNAIKVYEIIDDCKLRGIEINIQNLHNSRETEESATGTTMISYCIEINEDNDPNTNQLLEGYAKRAVNDLNQIFALEA